jgi:predicted nucleic acid-binding protein
MHVFDASPLIALGASGLLGIAEQSSGVVPQAVAREVSAGPDSDPARIWLNSDRALPIVFVPISSVVAAWGLGDGESRVISYAIAHPGAKAVLDNRAARACARTFGVPTRGTLGLLVHAKREGRVDRVRPLINAMLAAGYHLGDDLVAAVLKSVGERQK